MRKLLNEWRKYLVKEQFSLPPEHEAFYARKAELENKLCPPIVGTGQPDADCKAALNIETILPGYLPPCKPGDHPEMCNSKINDLGLRDDEWMVIQSSCKPSMERRAGVELVEIERCNYIILDPEKAEKSKPPKRVVKKKKRKRRKKKPLVIIKPKPTPKPVSPPPTVAEPAYEAPIGLPGHVSPTAPGFKYQKPGR